MRPENSFWFKSLINLLGYVGIFSMLFWWAPFCLAAGFLFERNLEGAIIAFLAGALMIILFKGTEKLYEYLGSGKE